jgi:hypothetical protein
MIPSLPFDADLARVLAIWTPGAWLVLLGWLALPLDHSDAHSRWSLASATIRATQYGAVMLLIAYLIPMTVVVAVGMSRIHACGWPSPGQCWSPTPPGCA